MLIIEKKNRQITLMISCIQFDSLIAISRTFCFPTWTFIKVFLSVWTFETSSRMYWNKCLIKLHNHILQICKEIKWIRQITLKIRLVSFDEHFCNSTWLTPISQIFFDFQNILKPTTNDPTEILATKFNVKSGTMHQTSIKVFYFPFFLRLFASIFSNL